MTFVSVKLTLVNMSNYNNTSTSQRPKLITTAKSSGWGWPRLVDIPTVKHTPTLRQSSSAQYYKSPHDSSERSPTDTRHVHRASSLSNLGSVRAASAEIKASEERPLTEISEDASHSRADVKDRKPVSDSPAVESPVPPGSSLPYERPKIPELNSSPELSKPGIWLESVLHMQPDPLTLEPRPNSPQNRSAEPSAEENVQGKPFQSPGNTITREHPKQSVSAHNRGSSSEISGSGAWVAHPFKDIGLETSKLPRSTVATAPTFRELRFEPESSPASALPGLDHKRTVSPPVAQASPDVFKVPPPTILIIKASGDSRASSDEKSHTAGFVNDVDSSPVEVITDLPNGLKDTTVSGNSLPDSTQLSQLQALPLPETVRTSGSPGFGQLPVVAWPKKRQRMIRKTRKMILRSPVLTIILGRQLAVLTRPAIEMIADGADLPPMTFIGQQAGVVSAAEGSGEAARSLVDAAGPLA
jgi:hypothetical protein